MIKLQPSDIVYYIPSDITIKNELVSMLVSRQTKADLEEGSVNASSVEPINISNISATKTSIVETTHDILALEPKEKSSCVGAKDMNNKPTYEPCFTTENAKHESVIPSVVSFFESEGCDIKVLEGKNDQGCDLKIRRRGIISKVELKTNAGQSNGRAYDTFILESHKDYDKTTFPEWRTSADYLVMVNLATNTGFLYNAARLKAWFDQQEAAGVEHTKTGKAEKTKEARNGWGYKVLWSCKDAGFIKTFSLEKK